MQITFRKIGARGVALLACLLGAGCSGGGGGGAGSGSEGGVPDLVAQAFEFTPASVQAGGQIHVDDTVLNGGSGDAGAFVVRVVLSPDAVLDASDLALGERSVSALASGTSSPAQGFLTIPTTTAAGTWYIGMLVDVTGAVAESDEANNQLVASTTLAVSSVPLPDLLPTQLDFTPTLLDAGSTVHVSDVVSNAGLGPASDFQLGVYLSTDATITQGDTLIGLRSLQGLAQGEVSFGEDDLTVPAGLTAGLYHVGLLVDLGGTVTESDEFNNTLVASGQLDVRRPPQPDLIADTVSSAQSAIDAGQLLDVYQSVRNAGSSASGPFRLGAYISEDADITTADTLIGHRSLAGLGVGETSVATTPFLVPAEVGGGTRYVGVIVDYEGAVAEEDEDNNVRLAPGTLTVTIPPLPDLRVSALSSSPAALEAGQALTVSEAVRNDGTASAGSFQVGVYLSQNQVISTSDVLLSSRLVAGLAIGEESADSSPHTLPSGVTAGSWYVGVIVDELAQVTELSEGNNVLLGGGTLDVTAAPDPHPDLLVSELASSTVRVLPGADLQVVNAVLNDGDLSTGVLSYVSFYLSLDDVIEPTDIFLGERPISSLGIGFSSAASVPYVVPADTPVGDYRLGAICDRYDAVAESDEDNNVRVATAIEVYVPPPPLPDLVVRSIEFTPTTAQPGDPVQLDITVGNDGELPSGTTRVAVYLSEDATVDTSDTLLGYRAIGGLAVGADSGGVSAFNLPPTLEPGSWTVAAIVDDQDLVEESDDDNNSRVATPTLEVQ